MDAVTLAQRFGSAVAARDEATARGLCAPGAWDARNGLLSLYRQLTGAGRRFRIDVVGPPSVSEWSRAALRCQVSWERQPVGMVSLLCDGIPGRMTGWSRSAIVGERYVAGLVPPRFGVEDLAVDDMAQQRAERLAERLAAAVAGDAAAQARLAEQEARSDAAARVLQHVQMRVRSGERLRIVRALRLAALGRVAVEARLGRPVRALELTGRALGSRLGAGAAGEALWLYADEGKGGRLLWSGITALFHADTLLA